jgi:hypothetical protein
MVAQRGAFAAGLRPDEPASAAAARSVGRQEAAITSGQAPDEQ